MSANVQRITAQAVDVDRLRTQLAWLLTTPACDERDGLIHLVEHMLDVAEGHA